MFWNGTRWMDERAPTPPRAGRRRRAWDWIATGVVIVGRAAGGLIGQAGLSATPMPTPTATPMPTVDTMNWWLAASAAGRQVQRLAHPSRGGAAVAAGLTESAGPFREERPAVFWEGFYCGAAAAGIVSTVIVLTLLAPCHHPRKARKRLRRVARALIALLVRMISG
jgi:hypothetical protein